MGEDATERTKRDQPASHPDSLPTQWQQRAARKRREAEGRAINSYVARCYVEDIRNLQKVIDQAEEAYPHLKDIKPRFGYDANSLGPALDRSGKEMFDPIVQIIWDMPKT